MIQLVIPRFPKASDGMWIRITGDAKENSNQKFESCSVDTMTVRPVKGLDDAGPVQGNVLQAIKEEQCVSQMKYLPTH